MEIEGANYCLKAMNCPMHNLIYRSRGRSYRELPLRLFEFGSVYRYEKSGVVHGLTRVRGMTQDDSHSYVTPEQAPAEIKHLLDFVPRAAPRLRSRRLLPRAVHPRRLQARQVRRLRGGVGDGDRRARGGRGTESGLELVADPGGAAFYGPKISVQARDAIGRTWQMSTIQYDFNQPRGFELEYQAADGTRQRPVMIHSAKFGSIERFIGVLVEHYAGAFPPWLAPGAGAGDPGRGGHDDYLHDVAKRLRAAGHPGRGRHLRRPDAEEDPQRPAAEGAVHADRRRRGRGGRRGVVPLPRRSPGQRRCPSTRRSPRSPRRSPVGPVTPCQIDVRDESTSGRSSTRGSATLPGPRTASTGCGRRTGWPTSRARTSRRRAAARLPVLPGPPPPTTEGLVVHRGELAYAVLNLYPYTPGHLLICPYRHLADYTELTDAEAAEIAASHPAGDAGRPRAPAAPHGFNLGHEPGRGRRCRHRRAPAPARGAALARRPELHAGHRPHQGAAAAAHQTWEILAPGDWVERRG